MVAHLTENFEKHWLDVLEPKRAAYACSLKSLFIDHDELGRILKETLEDEKSETIIVLSLSNVFLLTVQMISHCLMIIRWFVENPLEDRRTKRSIKVGLPVVEQSATMGLAKSMKKLVDDGHAVPEADRYERPKSIKHSEKIFGIPCTDEEEGKQIETPLANDDGQTSRMSERSALFGKKGRAHFG